MVSERKNILCSLTIDIVQTYETVNPSFKAQDVNNLPQRILTQPSTGASNGGKDNEEANLICKVYDKLYNAEQIDGTNLSRENLEEHKKRGSCIVYTVLDLLGTGTFGQVFRCQRSDTKEILAVKVVKNKKAYHEQALVEIKIAQLLNTNYDPNDKSHIVRFIEAFRFCNHICIVFETLSMSLLGKPTMNR